ncbi:uncharacterized protein LOC132059616 isoform X1 [Lycium ferocissimum]|uniref:uncharacterized protein LOC132059616 isoform X1 n=1 Tax=Lycium ferocissimum TaxID=112874 RepID=UPI0028166AF7|nr:uncharacterized protein LOC132059616 isoform X1 [Lycium ferocissimum]
MASSKRPYSGDSSRVSKKQQVEQVLWINSKRTAIREYEIKLLPTNGERACEILHNIRFHGWEHFVEHPGEYDTDIVSELYANINKDAKISMQGSIQGHQGNLCTFLVLVYSKRHEPRENLVLGWVCFHLPWLIVAISIASSFQGEHESFAALKTPLIIMSYFLL